MSSNLLMLFIREMGELFDFYCVGFDMRWFLYYPIYIKYHRIMIMSILLFNVYEIINWLKESLGFFFLTTQTM